VRVRGRSVDNVSLGCRHRSLQVGRALIEAVTAEKGPNDGKGRRKGKNITRGFKSR